MQSLRLSFKSANLTLFTSLKLHFFGHFWGFCVYLCDGMSLNIWGVYLYMKSHYIRWNVGTFLCKQQFLSCTFQPSSRCWKVWKWLDSSSVKHGHQWIIFETVGSCWEGCCMLHRPQCPSWYLASVPVYVSLYHFTPNQLFCCDVCASSFTFQGEFAFSDLL